MWKGLAGWTKTTENLVSKGLLVKKMAVCKFRAWTILFSFYN